MIPISDRVITRKPTKGGKLVIETYHPSLLAAIEAFRKPLPSFNKLNK